MTNKLNTSLLMNTVLCQADDTWLIYDNQGNIIEGGTDINQYINNLYQNYCFHNDQGDHTNQFMDDRYGIALLKGAYQLDVNIGYYTSLIGLGQRPEEVNINGKVQVPNSAEGWALDNFWRSCEGVSIQVSGDGKNYWRVSQAAPFRRNVVHGSLVMAEATETETGYASGGFMAECIVKPFNGQGGDIDMATQQQFCILSSKFENLIGGNWNFLFGGTESQAIPHQTLSQGKVLNTVVDHIDLIAGKPYLIAHSLKDFELAIPKLVGKAKGPLSYEDQDLEKTKNFSIVDNTVSIEEINAHLAKGTHIVFSPGIYHYDQPILVSQPNTVLLGLALATIVPTNGQEAIIVRGQGCRIAGLMVQAGAAPEGRAASPSLICVGDPQGVSPGDPENPTLLQDVFCRVGGPDLDGACHTMLLINQSHTILENTWNWRADHTDFIRQGLGVDKAQVDHCLIVNADEVVCYCLMIEHTLKELCVWNGDRGRIYFIQSELAYDVGDDTEPWDYPGLRVNGKQFYGAALGFYSFFSKVCKANENHPAVSTAVLVPEDAVIDSAMTIFLDPINGGGLIQHVINDRGQESNHHFQGIPSWCSFNSNLANQVCEESLRGNYTCR